MHKNNTGYKALDEILNISDSLSVFVILRDGQIKGRITSRYMKSGSVHVAFFMYSNNKQNIAVSGYRRMDGYGYDKLGTALADIFADNKQVLHDVHGISFGSPDWNIMNTWQKDFEAAGFQVIQAL